MDFSFGKCTGIEDDQLEQALNDPALHEILIVGFL
jgi:hypothetical protein